MMDHFISHSSLKGLPQAGVEVSVATRSLSRVYNPVVISYVTGLPLQRWMQLGVY